MQSAKDFTLRHFPKLSQWIFPDAEADHDAAADGNGLHAFSLSLTKRLAADAGWNCNLVFSPLSLYAALSLVAAGARERTLEELLGVLGTPSRGALADTVRELAGQALADRSLAGGPHISFACGVWHDSTLPLHPDYLDAATRSHNTVACAVDFHHKVSTYVQLISIQSSSRIQLDHVSVSWRCSRRKQRGRSTSGWRRRRTN
jgi:serine protease inhibitor